MERDRKKQSHRYYLQNCLKPPFVVDGVTMYITIPYESIEAIPVGAERYAVVQLIKHYGYNVQCSMLQVDKKTRHKKQKKMREPKRLLADDKQTKLF